MSPIDIIRSAVPLFAAQLGVNAPSLDKFFIEGSSGQEPVLDLHAAALVAVLSTRQQSLQTTFQLNMNRVLEELLGHEKRYWRGRAERLHLLEGPEGVTMEQLSQTVAAGCLLGASSQNEAIELLRRIPGLAPFTSIAKWLRDLYPPDSDEEWLGSMRPDRLAELHVISQLDASSDLAEACLTDLNARQARRALILLARASANHPAAQRLLEPALYRFPDVVKGVHAPRDTMIAIVNAIPHPSVALAETHASIVSQLLGTFSPGTAERGRWVNSYAVLLSDLGKREDALAANDEAVTIYRQLARSQPDAFLPDLAMSLNNQSGGLSGVGRRKDALAAIEEAITIYRQLARSQPDAFLPGLANSLNNQSRCLSELGWHEDALAAIEQAITIRRELARSEPDAFLPGLAYSLNNQSRCLSELGWHEDALAAIEEALTIHRELARSRPDAFLPELAMSLNSQSNCLRRVGRCKDALIAIDEAITIYHKLRRSRPDAILPKLANSLSNKSVFLSDLGRRKDALDTIEEAITIYRQLAQALPDAFEPKLADALHNRAWIASRP